MLIDVLALVASHEAVAGEYSVIDTVPSEDAAAKMSPSSWGAHAMLLMDAVCRVPGEMYTCVQVKQERSWHWRILGLC